mmetsp:Transcript_70092/g.217713  ORF Transcript_70092/g.217713 Transcript_70092/m.217713 type:complete len:437 (-) Transcript_70092:34-1344(-)
MDGLEELLAEAEAEASLRSAPKAPPPSKASVPAGGAAAKRPIVDRSAPHAAPDTLTSSCVDDARTAELAAKLKRLHFDLADPAIRESLRSELAATTPQQVLEYYASRPELAQYTLERELPRMAYRVIPKEGGEPLASPTDITALYASDVARRELGEDRGPEVLWRMANQSLFAGALQSVHCQLIGRHDDTGALCLAVATESAEFTLDLREGCLRASARISLNTLSGEGNTRLGLAAVLLAVEAEVSGDAGGHCLGFSQAVQELQPALVFEEQFASAAAALAELSPEAAEALARPSGDVPGFASVRAAAALGSMTRSALGVAATASASALGAATQGLRSLSIKGAGSASREAAGGVGCADSAGAPAGGGSSAPASSEFDDFFDDISGEGACNVGGATSTKGVLGPSAAAAPSQAAGAPEGAGGPASAIGSLFNRLVR